MTDTALETALFAAAGTKQGHRHHAEPDWDAPKPSNLSNLSLLHNSPST
jgi:hypothetical protein